MKEWPTRDDAINTPSSVNHPTHGNGSDSPKSVTEVRLFPPGAFEEYYRRKYRNVIRKGLFFIFREGFRSTLRKYRSKSTERRMEAAQHIVLAHCCGDSCHYVGITRALGGAPLRFHPALLFELPPNRSLDDVKLSAGARLLLESYLPVPSCPLPAGLQDAIVKANPFLRPPDVGHANSAEYFEPGAVAVTKDITSLRRHGPSVYLFGLGSYVREYILPHLGRDVVAGLDYKAALIQEHATPPFPVFDSAEPLYDLIARDPRPLVIICTYHSDHAWMANKVLELNPEARVFIEKPAAVALGDIERLAQNRRVGAWIDIGYNRRYAFLASALHRCIASLPHPLVLTFLVKEIKLAPTHWYFWPNQGTRITGNACHWIDLSYWLAGCPPVECTLQNSGDTVVLGIRFSDGSLATILATDSGDDTRGVEEVLDVRAGDTTVTVTDFRTLEIRSPEGRRRIARLRRDKGHTRMYADLKHRWLTGEKPRYSADDLYWVGRLTATFSDMLRNGIHHAVLPSQPDP